MITPTQMRAARAMLDVSQGHVAQYLGIAANTLSKIESGQSDVSGTRLTDIQRFYEREGVEFTENDGVKWAKESIQVYDGKEEFMAFMDDIYNTANEIGGEFCLFNARPDNWIELMGEENHRMHAQRMSMVADKVDVKITSKKGELNLISKGFAEYRWVPEKLFNEKSFYAYGDKLAFLNFDGENSRVLVLSNKEFSNGFRVLFNVAWDTIAEKID